MRSQISVLAAATLSLLAAVAPQQSSARDIYGRPAGNGTVLVTPDGEILDYDPDPASVQVRRDQYGRRVYLDNDGNIVATEMPMRRAVTRQRGADYDANRGWGYDEAPSGQSAGNRQTGGRNDGFSDDGQTYGSANGLPGTDGLTTGTLPRRINRDIPVESQPLPQAGEDTQATSPRQQMPGDDETASLDPEAGSLPPLANQLDTPAPKISWHGKTSLEVAALQIFLARNGMSPGVIDGRKGENVDKALRAYEATSGETIDPNNSEDIASRLAASGGMPFQQYTITSADAAGPYVASIPEDYSQKAQMPSMGYTSVTEMLSERFHMDENYLKSLNPGVDFTIPGTIIKVANPGEGRKGDVARIVANKRVKEVQAFDAQGNLIAAYPASIGSSDTPSPSGTHTVARIAFNPDYTYNPKINFRQGANDKVLTVPPGPNGPVGNVWIALSKPTYGIHGTPDPSKIGKTQSHGCVRLTNWDANELAHMVKPGTIVQFVD